MHREIVVSFNIICTMKMMFIISHINSVRLLNINHYNLNVMQKTALPNQALIKVYFYFNN